MIKKLSVCLCAVAVMSFLTSCYDYAGDMVNTYKDLKSQIIDISIDLEQEHVIRDAIKPDVPIFGSYVGYMNGSHTCSLRFSEGGRLYGVFKTQRDGDWYFRKASFDETGGTGELIGEILYLKEKYYYRNDFEKKRKKVSAGSFEIPDYFFSDCSGFEFSRSYNVLVGSKPYICEEWKDGEYLYYFYFINKELIAARRVTGTGKDAEIINIYIEFSRRADETKLKR